MKLIIPAIIVIMSSAVTHAAIPEKVIIKARKGNITFNHKKHVDAGLFKDCTVCHSSGEVFKIGKQGMEKGHSVCRFCHTDMEAGPRNCDGCHQ